MESPNVVMKVTLGDVAVFKRALSSYLDGLKVIIEAASPKDMHSLRQDQAAAATLLERLQ